VPIEVEDDQAFVTLRIGRQSFRALLDSGATSLSLPETGADGLIASGAATEGPQSNVSHADGVARPRRTIIINTLSIGGHVVHDVKSVVEPDTSIPLVGLAVLRAISPRFAIDLAGAELRFE
jgi:predicted aspartyl protease